MDAKADIDKEIKRREKTIEKINPKITEFHDAINDSAIDIEFYKSELKQCPKIMFIKYHDLEEKIAHAQAYIEGTKKNRKAYLKKNGFATIEKYNEYVVETSKMARASKVLNKKIKEEQTTFDAVYARLDDERDISQIVLDPRDVEEFKAELKQEFGKDFSDADIEKAEKQFCDNDNADPSTHRKLEKIKEILKKKMKEKRNLEYL